MRIAFIIPGDINLPTGGYRYDKEIINAWRDAGIEVNLISMAISYPFPTRDEKLKALRIIENDLHADMAIIDGLLGGTFPDLLETISKQMPVIALIHHPLCLENGLDEKTAKTLEANEREGLAFATKVVTTSETTAQTVAKIFGFDEKNIHAVLPGVARGFFLENPKEKSSSVNLLCVGSVIERKGHLDLINALASLRDLDWKLDCYGSTAFDPPLFAKIKDLINAHALSDKITFHGAVVDAAIEAAYLHADIFVLPSHYEGYGMVYAEAIVRGLPVIATTAGAIPKTVPQDCGILVEPGNIVELQEALAAMITNDKLRLKYKYAAINAESRFPTWERSANNFCKILKELL